MKKFFTSSAMTIGFLAASSMAFATNYQCNGPSGNAGGGPVGDGGLDITTLTSGACVNGPLTFSNFAEQNVLNDPNVSVSFVANASPLSTGDDYFLYLSPNLTGPAPQDIHIVFSVTGGNFTSVSLNDTGGTLSSIGEHVCTLGVDLTSGSCTNGGVQLANLSANDSSGNQVATFAGTGTLWIWKDISILSGGHQSGLTQDFLAIPEPATISMLGAGLLGLGLLGRRLRNK